MLLWVMNLGFGGGGGEAGPYYIAAGQVYHTGAVKGEIFVPGEVAGQVYHTGAAKGEVK